MSRSNIVRAVLLASALDPSLALLVPQASGQDLEAAKKADGFEKGIPESDRARVEKQAAARVEQLNDLESAFTPLPTETTASQEELERAKERLATIAKQGRQRTEQLKKLSAAASNYARTVANLSPEAERDRLYTDLFRDLYAVGIQTTALRNGLQDLPHSGVTAKPPIIVGPIVGIDRSDPAWILDTHPRLNLHVRDNLDVFANLENIGADLVVTGSTGSRFYNTANRLHDSQSVQSLPDFKRNLRTLDADVGESYLDYRVTDGEPDAENEFPCVVAVGYQLGRVSEWKATGVLVAPNVVLTAAHCYNSCNEKVGGRVFFGLSVDLPGRVVQVERAERYPGYLKKLPDGRLEINDLMVLILKELVTDQPVYPLVPVDALNMTPRPAFIRAIGYGATNDHGGGYGVRRLVNIPIACYCDDGKPACGRFICDPGLEFIAGRKGKATGEQKTSKSDTDKKTPDICRGDSVGGVFVRDHDGHWMLAGLTSRGTPENRQNNHDCGDGGIYVRLDIAKYRGWIMSVKGGHWGSVKNHR